MPRLPLPAFDLSGLDLTAVTPQRVARLARDVGYVAIGFGVLGVQQAQVRRREVTATISRVIGNSGSGQAK
ncbi:MAG TPA: hypothetical protein PLV13_06340 [Ilumatobacteraceae bacterium]|nr:hypothetical protein [Ilumatobacteraceae bacterium]